MPNLAALLKDEISRLARKEIRTELAGAKKASAQQRSQIAALRKQVEQLARSVKQLARANARTGRASVKTPEQEEGTPLRFRAQGLVSHRKRLGLTRAAFGKLLGVTDQSVYKWETGQSRPRREQLEALAGVRKMGRLAARAKLEASAR